VEDRSAAQGALNDDAGSGPQAESRDPRGGSVLRRRDPLPTDVRALPTLPPAFDSILDAGLASLHVLATPRQRAALGDHVRLLLAWTQAINLTSIRDPAAAAREHVLDSLTAVPLLRARGVTAVLDLGSGGGFPGIPLAVILPARRVLLVESVGKKARFLATAVAGLGLEPQVAVAAARAEELASDPHQRGAWQAVVARAVTNLAELAELALPLLAPGGLLLAWKRRPLEDELGRAGPAIATLGGGEPALTPVGIDGLSDHVLVAITQLRRAPAGFPRDPASRRRRPLG
jgi:16S rRNA (guanine527-N7)-methyltransferase